MVRGVIVTTQFGLVVRAVVVEGDSRSAVVVAGDSRSAVVIAGDSGSSAAPLSSVIVTTRGRSVSSSDIVTTRGRSPVRSMAVLMTTLRAAYGRF